LTNAPIAMRMGEINKLAEKTKSEIIPADATNVDELTSPGPPMTRCASAR
jgi:enoyl-[acyl-carrier protein] reductase I